MLKKTIAIAAALAAISPVAVAAEDEGFPGDFSANVALTSDYTFRGISQTDEAPAIQGGFDWSMEAGAVTPYVGVWASNVDFNIDETLELDVYGGLKTELGPVAVDAGLIYYAYPNSGPDYNFLETKLGLSASPIDMVSLAAAWFYSPDYFNESGSAHYFNGAVTVAPGLPLDIAFTGSVGYQWIDDAATFGLVGTDDYVDWSLGVSATVEGFVLSAAYIDTNLSQAECGGLTVCDPRGVFKVSRAF